MDRRAFVAAAVVAPLAHVAVARSSASGGRGVALVTADLESHVAAVAVATGRIVARIRTGPGPRSIESARQLVAVVAHSEQGLLTLLDGRSLRVVAELDTFDEARYTAIDRRGLRAYVTDSGRGELVTVDLVRRRIVGRVALPGPARHVSLHPAGHELWAALGSKAARVAVVRIDGRGRTRLVRSFEPPFLAHDVVFGPGGVTAWVTSGSERRLALYDVRSRSVRRLLAADAPPQHVSFDRRRAYVASGDDRLLRVHRLDGRVVRSERVPRGSYNVQRDGGVVLTPSLANGMLTIAGADGRTLRRVPVARSSHDACLVVTA